MWSGVYRRIVNGSTEEYVSEDLITIIIPVYNVVDELPRCIASVDAQTYGNLQVVLVDDGSTDGSRALCDDIAATRANFTVVHKINGGLSSARNAGLNHATGDWLMFLDSDDTIAPTACEDLLECARRCDADIVVGDAIHEIGDEVEEMNHTGLKPCVPYVAAAFIEEAIRAHQFYAPVCFCFFKRSLFVDNDLRFAEGLLHEDMEMQPRVFLAAHTVACSGKAFYHYIDRSDSIMNSSKVLARKDAMTSIYAQWKRMFDSIEDKELRTALNGHLAKCYLHTVRTLGCGSLGIKGVDSRFLFRVGLDSKEKLKAILYAINPKLLAVVGGRN